MAGAAEARSRPWLRLLGIPDSLDGGRTSPSSLRARLPFASPPLSSELAPELPAPAPRTHSVATVGIEPGRRDRERKIARCFLEVSREAGGGK